MNPLLEIRTTVFSPERAYRYRLKQTWDPALPHIVYCLLNPSTADEQKNDPTVERCERRARATKGCGASEIINIFAYRATNPLNMKAQTDPVGPDNDHHIIEAAKGALMVICGWGNHGAYMGRGKMVEKLLRDNGIPLHYLRLGKEGQPGHPLYIGYDVMPTLW